MFYSHVSCVNSFQMLKENAQPSLTIAHFPDFKDTKGIVLMAGKFDEKFLVSQWVSGNVLWLCVKIDNLVFKRRTNLWVGMRFQCVLPGFLPTLIMMATVLYSLELRKHKSDK